MEPDRWRKVEQIYHAAREVEEGQRAAFIAKACAGDQALMQELRTLLAQPQATGSFLEAPALDVAAKALANEYSITHPERFCSVEDSQPRNSGGPGIRRGQHASGWTARVQRPACPPVEKVRSFDQPGTCWRLA